MLSSQTALFLMALLLLAVILEPLARKLKIPFSIVLILLGFAGSEIITKQFGLDTGIRWDNFQFLILQVFLPVVIFQGALKLDVRLIFKDIIPLILLALPLMLIAVAVIACILYYGIGYPRMFPWQSAILAGALLSATDPSSVIEMLKRFKAPGRLATLLEGESLFNDAIAVVLFMLLVSMQFDTAALQSWQTVGISFANVFSGGILVGVLCSIVVYFLTRFIQGPFFYTLITIVAVYSSFIIAGDILGCSGVMAVLTLGLLLNEMPGSDKRAESVYFTETLWQFLSLMVDRLIYILAGLSITLSMFKEQWLAMILGIVAVLLARALIILLLLPLCCAILRVKRIPLPQLFILNWGRLRGTVTLALALSLPLSLDSWFTLQSIAYGVVLFTLFVQLTSMPILVKRLPAAEE